MTGVVCLDATRGSCCFCFSWSRCVLLLLAVSWSCELLNVAQAAPSISPGAPGDARLQRLSPCQVLWEERLINLAPLGQRNFKPRYQVTVRGWTYSFNPCFPFNIPEEPYGGLGDQCNFVALCKSRDVEHGVAAYTLGIQQTTEFQLRAPPRVSSAELGSESSWSSSEERGEDTSEEDEESDEESSEEGEEGQEDDDEDEEEEEKQEQDGEGGQGEGKGAEEGEEDEAVEFGGGEQEEKGGSDNSTILIVSNPQGRPERPQRRGDTQRNRARDRSGRARSRGRPRRRHRHRHRSSVPQGTAPPQEIPSIHGQNADLAVSLATPAGDADPPRQRRSAPETPDRDPNLEVKVATEEDEDTMKGPNISFQPRSDLRSRTQRLLPTIQLMGTRTQSKKRTIIYLVCDTKQTIHDEGEFNFLKSKGTIMYFELRHLCCCPDACSDRYQLSASQQRPLDGEATPVAGGGSWWPPHQLLWVVVAVFLIIIGAIVIGTLCCRTGSGRGPYTMLPGLHASRLTISSMDSARMPTMVKFPSPDYLDYTSPKLKQLQYPNVENGIINMRDLEIGQRLGGGLFGDTYLGDFQDRNVAAKRITVGVHQGQLTEQDRAWLSDVVSILSRQQHKHVLTVLGICLDLRQPHIIKEFVEGDSLKDLLQNVTDGSLTYRRKFKMLAQAADAMAYLHAAKRPILHRDLRCANLIVSKVNDHVKITDFGMVMLLHRLREQCTGREGCYCRKSTPAWPASIRWTAPEVLANPTASEEQGAFGPPCDVYSFGMTMWEAVNHCDPWSEFQDEQMVISHVLQGKRPEVTTMDNIPDYHEGLIKACWAENSRTRPTFKQVVSHLYTILKQLAKDERRDVRRNSGSSTMTYFRSALNIPSQ